MATFVSLSLIAGSVFFFFLAFIFAITGYTEYWLVPREEYVTGSNEIEGVGLRIACFTQFQFPESVRDINYGTTFDGCVDNSRNSARFNDLTRDVWSPQWFQTVQDMHLASIIMMVLNMLLISGFLTVYFYTYNRVKKRKKPSIILVMTRCGLGLWFIFTLILAFVLLSEPLIFYINYQQSTQQFYFSNKLYDYGPGFGLTCGAGLCLLVSVGLSIVTYVGMIKKLISTTLKPEDERMNNESHHDEQHSGDNYSDFDATETEKSSRKDPEGLDESIAMQDYQKEPNKNSYYESDDDSRRKPSSERPVPTPRPRQSVSSREVSRAGSVAAEDVAVEYPSPEKQHHRSSGLQDPSGYDSASQHMSPRSPNRPINPHTFQYDYQPGVGYVPKSARPVGYSDRVHSAHMSPYSPAAGVSYYNPSGQRSYAGSYTPSDTESVRSDRNRSVSRASVTNPRHSSPQAPESNENKVVKPKQTTDVKKSRYAAAGW